MRTSQRLGAIGVLAAAATSVVMWTPVSAARQQISGAGVFDMTGETCGPPPSGYEDFTDYPPIVLTGDLDGCWYTNVEASRDNGAPSGVYLEQGREVFVGSVQGGPVGTFETTYRFESRWDPDVSSGPEVFGRCQHPIVAGTGTAGLSGATGRLNFRDIVADGSYTYSGHVAVG